MNFPSFSGIKKFFIGEKIVIRLLALPAALVRTVGILHRAGCHVCRIAGLYAGHDILEHQTFLWSDSKPPGRFQIDVRRRLSSLHLTGGDNAVEIRIHAMTFQHSLDQEMSSVRNEIMDAQNSSQMQSNLVSDILSNIENLYKLTNKREVAKIQDEFLRVYETNDLQQLERFHRQLDIIAESYRAQAVAVNIK